ncbi:heterokaryon incompatibility protein-domain-containing protein [Sordaria brevicollis]|uniref:Heterokaryon incompatibility protein-domain-containing protein n=1 Tax=Sordaria brevicollis TaxID=83679 RepID=A0AAE0P2V6_SORBR|nr:heterokaryon incompatibility protein-domain-containing protein [Sordaria brevicollis]
MPPLSECLDQKWPRIRLLTLSGPHSPTFETISLETHWSTVPEKYIALSYEWGKSEPDDPYITVDRRPVQVRKNLYEAMKQIFKHRLQGLKRHLEQQDCSHRDECTCSEPAPDDLGNSSVWAQHNPLRLWIDALCINQSDHQEKSNQVGKMGRIFSSASLVLAWTGLPRDGSDDAIKILRMSSDELSKFVATGALTDTRRASVVSFCERTYWRRVWILQELFLAKDYFVMCGSGSVASKSLDQALTHLSQLDQQTPDSTGAAAEKQQTIRTTPAHSIVLYKRTKGFCTLFRWLLLCLKSNFQATVPHDYIYALLSISWDGVFETNYGQLDKSKIEIDYDKSVMEVFRQLLQSFEDDPTVWHRKWLLEFAQKMSISKEEANTLLDCEHLRRRSLGPIPNPTQYTPGPGIIPREKQKNLFDLLPDSVLRAIQKQLDQGHINDFEVELDQSLADFYRQLLESCRNNPPRGFSMERTFPPPRGEAADDMLETEEERLEDEFMMKSVFWTEYREYKRERMNRRAQKQLET